MDRSRKRRRIPKTLYVPIYAYDGQVIPNVTRSVGRLRHTATIRSDWTEADWEELRRMFDGCCVISKSLICPVWLLGQKWHNTDFRGMKKFSR